MAKKYEKIKISTEYITLGQLVKFANLVSSGSEAKMFILEENILVNGEDCKIRGKKLRPGDKIVINNTTFLEIEW